LSLNANPLVVSLVQVANSLPIFLFALPAGALADLVDKRRLLIVLELATTLVSAIFAAMVGLGRVTPVSLLLFMFAIGVGGALTTPAWQSIVPMLVPRQDLPPAIAANSVGVNISRALGPALGGVMIGLLGLAAPFWLNAVSNLAVIGALLWWRPPAALVSRLPPEPFGSAMRAGLRYVRHSARARAAITRAAAFFAFASAYWALLPLIARQQIAGGPQLYGILLGAIGAGAVAGAVLLRWLKKKFSVDAIVKFATLGTAAAMALLGIAHTAVLGLIACLVAGASWIAALASLNGAAQMALPDWVRGRGLAMYVTVFFGVMTLGSILWGEVASIAGLPLAHFLAAGGAALTLPLLGRWKLHSGAGLDLSPSMHWAVPLLERDIEHDRGPVLVTVSYTLAPGANRGLLIDELQRLAHERRRDGAYQWAMFEDTAKNGEFFETFLVASWAEHMRQHARVTNADRILQERLHALLAGAPVVKHLIAVEPAPSRR
jgi:predicted MFS family arabinose efflux permease